MSQIFEDTIKNMSHTEQIVNSSSAPGPLGAPTGDPPRYLERRRSWLTEDILDDDDDSEDDAILLPILPLELAVVCCMTNFLLPGVGGCNLFLSVSVYLQTYRHYNGIKTLFHLRMK